MLRIAADWLDLVLKLLIPVAVALVTKANASARVKAVVSMILAAAVTLLTEARLDDGSALLSFDTVQTWALNLSVAVATYLGFWRPVVDVNDKAAPEVGIG